MSYWGKLLGGVAGFALGGPFGAAVGAALGHAADSGALPRVSFADAFGGMPFNPARLAAALGRKDQLFAIGVVVLSAKLAKVGRPGGARGDRHVQAAVPHPAGGRPRHRPAVRPGAGQF